MEVIMLYIETLFKCYNPLGSITLMMLASALPEMMTLTPSSNVFSNFPPFIMRKPTT